MPVITIIILKSTAMPGPGNKTLRFIRCRVIGAGRKRPQRAIRYVNAIAIAFKLGARRGILQVIFAVMPGHPRAFYPWVLRLIIIVTGAFPTKLFFITVEKGYRLADRIERFSIQFDAINRVYIRAPVIKKQAPVIIHE